MLQNKPLKKAPSCSRGLGLHDQSVNDFHVHLGFKLGGGLGNHTGLFNGDHHWNFFLKTTV